MSALSYIWVSNVAYAGGQLYSTSHEPSTPYTFGSALSVFNSVSGRTLCACQSASRFVFFAVDHGGSNGYISYTDNGTTYSTPVSLGSFVPSFCAYGNGIFVVADSSTAGQIATSSDGVTWTTRSTGITSSNTLGVVFNGTVFCLSLQGSSGTSILTSTDGITWVARTTPAGVYGRVYVAGTTFVVLGGAGPGGMYSTNGTTWVSHTYPTTQPLGSANGLFFVINSPSTFSSTSDGINFSSPHTITISDGALGGYGNSIAHINGNYIVGTIGTSNGSLHVSSDLSTWTNITSPNLAGVQLLVAGPDFSTGTPPVTGDGTFSTAQGSPISIDLNTLITGYAATSYSFDGSNFFANGSADITFDGILTYYPYSSFAGVDHCGYFASNAYGTSSPAGLITINVVPPPPPPPPPLPPGQPQSGSDAAIGPANTAVFTEVADFHVDGLNIGRDARVMTYLYGLADFWAYVFEDSSVLNIMLEADAIKASDIYSHFLQLTTSLSIEDVQTLTSSQLKLEFLGAADAVQGKVETYQLREKISFARMIANRPFLPTQILEEGVDFFIDQATSQISFATPLSSSLFSFRILPDGSKEYGLWFVDSRLDENLIYQTFGSLIGINQPSRSTDNFSNFVYGLYYTYVNGPNLLLVRKGLNLALGVPLARDNEVVLEIRKYLNTDQFLVITDLNTYLIPYGLTPNVSVGDTLNVGDELSLWVEIEDFESDGAWWLNYRIPERLIPNLPEDSPSSGRYAVPDGYLDYVMRNYLKNHTFLAKINTAGFRLIENFSDIADIIHRVKPTYTSPIYVWTVTLNSESFTLTDNEFSVQPENNICENIFTDRDNYTRNSLNPVSRGCAIFNRFSAPMRIAGFVGQDPNINGTGRTFEGKTVIGFVAPQQQFAQINDKDLSWIKALYNRQNGTLLNLRRNTMAFCRGASTTGYSGGYNFVEGRYPGYRAIPLYVTDIDDLTSKFETVGEAVPDRFIFSLYKPGGANNAINTTAIDGNYNQILFIRLVNNFATLFFRTSGYYPWLGKAFTIPDSFKTYDGTHTLNSGLLSVTDFLAFVRMSDRAIAVYWMTKNFNVIAWPYIPLDPPDKLNLTITGPFNRGSGLHGCSVYVLRSMGATITSSLGIPGPIDSRPVDAGPVITRTLTVSFGDALNPTLALDRSGRQIKSQIIR